MEKRRNGLTKKKIRKKSVAIIFIVIILLLFWAVSGRVCPTDRPPRWRRSVRPRAKYRTDSAAVKKFPYAFQDGSSDEEDVGRKFLEIVEEILWRCSRSHFCQDINCDLMVVKRTRTMKRRCLSSESLFSCVH